MDGKGQKSTQTNALHTHTLQEARKKDRKKALQETLHCCLIILVFSNAWRPGNRGVLKTG